MRWHSLSHLKAPLPLVFFLNCALSLGLPAGTALANCPRSLVALINYIFICLVGQGVTKAEVRGRPLRVSSLLPSCGFGGIRLRSSGLAAGIFYLLSDLTDPMFTSFYR